jgi:hypothetical protein
MVTFDAMLSTPRRYVNDEFHGSKRVQVLPDLPSRRLEPGMGRSVAGLILNAVTVSSPAGGIIVMST